MTHVRDAFKILEEGQITLLLVNGQHYNTYLPALMKLFSERYDRISYVALTRPYSKILKDFKEFNIDCSKFRFISVAPLGAPAEKVPNCEYFNPTDLSELSKTAKATIENNKTNVFVFDSLHTMEAYHPRDMIVRFAHDLILKVDATKCKGVFPMAAGEKGSPLTNDLEVFMDNVVEIG
jgi:hypothetical protein